MYIITFWITSTSTSTRGPFSLRSLPFPTAAVHPYDAEPDVRQATSDSHMVRKIKAVDSYSKKQARKVAVKGYVRHSTARLCRCCCRCFTWPPGTCSWPKLLSRRHGSRSRAVGTYPSSRFGPTPNRYLRQTKTHRLNSIVLRGEATVKFMVVHNVNNSIETCLLSINLYGQNKLFSTKYVFLPGARAPPKLNVASP